MIGLVATDNAETLDDEFDEASELRETSISRISITLVSAIRSAERIASGY